jgi:Fe-S cluster assembly protein SufD
MPLRRAATGQETIVVLASTHRTLFFVIDDQHPLRSLTVTVEHGATCDCVVIQDLPYTMDAELTLQGTVEAGAALHWHLVSVGGRTATQTLHSTVSGAHGESSIDWICHAGMGQRPRLAVKNRFEAADGRGEIAIRIAAEAGAVIRADGLIEIGAQGGGTQTFLSQKTLMLDPSAQAEVIPSLEIHTNDVNASHGATVSRLSPEDLFAFAARGIGPDEARAMLTEGFLQELLARFPAPHDAEARRRLFA